MKIIRTEEVQRTKFTKGITLISLAVTIVVLLILAGVSISAIVGDNGIIKKAQESADLSKEAEAKEIMNRVVLEYDLSNNGETLEDFLQTKVPSRIDKVINNGDGTLTISKNGYTLNVKNKSSNSSGNNGGNSESGNEEKDDGTITITATPYKGVYDGISHEVFTSVSTVPSDATIEYSTDGTNFSTVMPTITNASSATVTIRASKTGYKTKTTNMVATIEKAEGKLTLSETSGILEYPKSSTITVSDNTGELSVSSLNESVATASINGNIITIKPVTTGTTTIIITSAASINYTEKTAEYSITINNPIFTGKSGIGYYADVDGDGTIDGQIFADFVAGKSNSLYKYTIPTITNPKSYYLDTTNYNGKNVLTTNDKSGNCRFYVMALNDVGGTYDFDSAQLLGHDIWHVPSTNSWKIYHCELEKISNSSKYWTSSSGYIDNDSSNSEKYDYYVGGQINYTTNKKDKCYVKLMCDF